jgi:hypothetical protein
MVCFLHVVLDPHAVFQKERLCKSCSRNQLHIIELLAAFDPEDTSIVGGNIARKYRQSLEERYPLCSSCKWVVELELQRQHRWLRSYKLNVQLNRSQKHRTMSLLHSSRGYRVGCNSMIVGQLLYIVFRWISSESMIWMHRTMLILWMSVLIISTCKKSSSSRLKVN